MKNRGWSSCVPFPRRSRHVTSPRPWKAGKLYPRDWIPIDAKKFEFFFNFCERRMENSLRDLLDQLEWTNFSRVSTKDSVEKFEQVQFCTVSFNFHFTTLIELKKEGITCENSLFKHDWKKFEFPSIRRNYNFYEQRMENSLRYFLEWTIWMDRFLQSFAQLRILWKNSMSILFIQLLFITRLLSSSEKTKE